MADDEAEWLVCSNGCEEGWFMCAELGCNYGDHDEQCQVCDGYGYVAPAVGHSTLVPHPGGEHDGDEDA